MPRLSQRNCNAPVPLRRYNPPIFILIDHEIPNLNLPLAPQESYTSDTANQIDEVSRITERSYTFMERSFF